MTVRTPSLSGCRRHLLFAALLLAPSVLPGCGPSQSGMKISGAIVPPVAGIPLTGGTVTLASLDGTLILAQAQPIDAGAGTYALQVTAPSQQGLYKLGFALPSPTYPAGYLLTRLLVLPSTTSTIAGDLTASSSIVAMGLEYAYRTTSNFKSPADPSTLESQVPASLVRQFGDLVTGFATLPSAPGAAVPTVDPDLAFEARIALSGTLGAFQ